jgi:DNA-binding LacI/PurR family transcriptional regulator
MAKKDLEKQKQKNLVKKLWENKGPRYLQMMDEYIMQNFNSEDKDERNAAHKLFGRVMDANVSKAALITKTEDGPNILDERINKFIDAMTLGVNQKMIEVEEAELVVSEDQAKEIRNGTRK